MVAQYGGVLGARVIAAGGEAAAARKEAARPSDTVPQFLVEQRAKWQSIDRPTSALSDVLADGFALFDTDNKGYVPLTSFNAQMLEAVQFTARGIWKPEDMERLELVSDGERLLAILHDLDTYKTGVVTPKTFKAGIYVLAQRQLLVNNAVGQMLSIDQAMTTILTSFRTEVEDLKKDFRQLHQQRLDKARAATDKFAAKAKLAGDPDEVDISIEEYTTRVRVKLAHDNAAGHVRILENEGLAQLNLRLMEVQNAQDDTLDKFLASIETRKQEFIREVLDTRKDKAEREAILELSRTQMAEEHRIAQEQRDKDRAEEGGEIAAKTDELKATIRHNITKELETQAF